MEAKKEKKDVIEQESPSKETIALDVEGFFGAETKKFSESHLMGVDDKDHKDLDLSLLFDLELMVSVELARKNLPIREILQLGEGAIIEFNKLAEADVDIYVNNKKIAQGEVVVVDDRFGVRITSLVNPIDRLKGITT